MNSFEKAIIEWLETGKNYQKVIDQSLIKEMEDWSKKWSVIQQGSKALRIYCKCILKGKIELARKIEAEYGKDFPRSDRVLALHLTLLSTQNKV